MSRPWANTPAGRRAATGATLLATAALLSTVGCAGKRASLVDAFPPAASAAPWELDGEVWAGTFDEAAPALGDDAKTWAALEPTRVWLAVYTHQQRPGRRLTVRCLAFESPDRARQAYDAFKPPAAKSFDCGDDGCWTEIGVLIHWRRLVLDIFGDSPSWNSEVESAMLAGRIEQLMPPGAPDDPR